MVKIICLIENLTKNIIQNKLILSQQKNMRSSLM